MFSPSPFMWKMVKDAPNHVMMNMIGLEQTSREIFKEPLDTMNNSDVSSLMPGLNL